MGAPSRVASLPFLRYGKNPKRQSLSNLFPRSQAIPSPAHLISWSTALLAAIVGPTRLCKYDPMAHAQSVTDMSPVVFGIDRLSRVEHRKARIRRVPGLLISLMSLPEWEWSETAAFRLWLVGEREKRTFRETC